MSRIDWNTSGSRVFEAGVDRGVLYVGSAAGVPWVGLISVEENPDGGEVKSYYMDGLKYLNVSTSEEFAASINAFTYPVEFSQCSGTARIRPGLFFGQQNRKPFSFSYRTKVGNDTKGSDFAYKIHLVYNAMVAPSSRSLSTYGDSAEASNFTWEVVTKSRRIEGTAPTAHVVIESQYTHPVTLATIEDILYGSASDVARMPTPEELLDIFDTPVEFIVDDISGGKFTITGPATSIVDIGLGKFVIDDPAVTDIGDGSYAISS